MSITLPTNFPTGDRRTIRVVFTPTPKRTPGGAA